MTVAIGNVVIEYDISDTPIHNIADGTMYAIKLTLLLLQNLYSAQIQACLSRRRWILVSLPHGNITVN